MTEPTQEEIREVWQRCGFRDVYSKDIWRDRYIETNHWWESPKGKRYLELPIIDLNNLFKYALPKAIEKLVEQSKTIVPPLSITEITAFREIIERWEGSKPLQFGFEKTLFWTIKEIIHQEEKVEMKILGKCKAEDLIGAITEAWNKAKLEEIGIGEVWTLDETDTELISKN